MWLIQRRAQNVEKSVGNLPSSRPPPSSPFPAPTPASGDYARLRRFRFTVFRFTLYALPFVHGKLAQTGIGSVLTGKTLRLPSDLLLRKHYEEFLSKPIQSNGPEGIFGMPRRHQQRQAARQANVL